jgi:hypothetical protein
MLLLGALEELKEFKGRINLIGWNCAKRNKLKSENDCRD